MDRQRDLLLAPLVGGSPGPGEVHPDDLDRPEGLAHRRFYLSLHFSEFDLLGNYPLRLIVLRKKICSNNVLHEKMIEEKDYNI